MWHPNKAAFRAGSIGSAGTEWDDPNTGYYSWAGGYNTTGLGLASFAMGYQSTALGSYSTALGYTANADGTGAVALGYRVTADADYAVSLGHRASADGHSGTFNFGDESTTDSIEATANNQFNARAAGGFRFRTNATLTTGCNLPAGSGVFSCSSSRALKEHFGVVDGEELLARLRGVPVSTWSYISEGGQVRHLGPFAEDFRAAFGLGTDDRSIGLLDIDGVNFAAVKALESRTAELQRQLGERDQRIADLEARLARIEAALAARPSN